MGAQKMWRNLLPQGTRTIEICSSYAMLIGMLLIGTGVLSYMPQLDGIDSDHTWAVLLGTFGGMHLFSVMNTPKYEILRTCMCWIVGCFWIWISVVSIGPQLGIDDLAAFGMGIGNLYGFIINFNLIHRSWTD